MKTLNSKLIFAGLQLADLLTTLACFHFGLVELNPLNAKFIAAFGILVGLVVSKLLACAIVLPMKRLTWVANIVYFGVVGWNFVLAVVFAIGAMSHAFAKAIP